MIIDSYVFEESWIENSNLAPLPGDCKQGVNEGVRLETLKIGMGHNITLNVLCKIAKLVISVSGQQIFVWGLAKRHHGY